MPLPQATRTQGFGVTGFAERTQCAVVILRPSCCGYLASIERMSCNTANARRYLASRQTEHRYEVAAHLAAVNLEGQEK